MPNSATLTIEPEILIRVVQPNSTGHRKAFEDSKEGTSAAPTWSVDDYENMFVLSKASVLGKAGLKPNKLGVINGDGKGFEVVLDTSDYKSGAIALLDTFSYRARPYPMPHLGNQITRHTLLLVFNLWVRKAFPDS